MKGRRSARKKAKCHFTLLLCIGRAVEILSHKHDADDACRFCIDDECMFSASVQHNTTHKKRGGEGGDSSFFFCFVLFVTTLSRDRRDPLKAKRWEGAERGDERGEIEFNGRQRQVHWLAFYHRLWIEGCAEKRGRHVMQKSERPSLLRLSMHVKVSSSVHSWIHINIIMFHSNWLILNEKSAFLRRNYKFARKELCCTVNCQVFLLFIRSLLLLQQKRFWTKAPPRRWDLLPPWRRIPNLRSAVF